MLLLHISFVTGGSSQQSAMEITKLPFRLWICLKCFLLFTTLFNLRSVAAEEDFELSRHGAVELEMNGGRRLLQALLPCPIDMASQNYSACTSICKGPNYPPGPCCQGLKAVICPIVLYFNNQSTDCANQLFSYLNLAGNYPGGLFSNICVEGQEGLACPLVPVPSPSHGLKKFKLGTAYLFHLFSLLSLVYFSRSFFS